MKKDKIVQFLSALDDAGRKSFRIFLASPCYNSKPEYLEMAQMIWDQVVDKDREDYGEEELWRDLYGEAPYNQNILRQRKSKLIRLFESFLEYMGRSEQENDLFFRLKALDRLGLYAEYDKVYGRYHKQLTKGSVQSGKQRYELYRLISFHITVMAKRSLRKEITHLEEIHHYLRDFHQIEGWRIVCAEMNQCLILREDIPQWVEDFKAQLGQPAKDAPILVQLFYQISLTLEDIEDEALFHHLMAMLEAHKEELAREELIFVYQYARNYSIRKYNQGRPGYHEKLNEIYLRMFEGGMIAPEEKIPGTSLKNVILNYLHRGEVKKAEQSYERFKDRLMGPGKENYLQYVQARILFAKGKFKRCLKLCDPLLADHNDVFFGLDGRTLMARCYYELGDWDSARALYDAYRMFLKRRLKAEQLAKNHHDNYYLFLSYYKKLLDLSAGQPGEKVAGAIEVLLELKEMDRFPSKEWVEEKLAILANPGAKR